MKNIILLLAVTLMTSAVFAQETVMTRKTHRDALDIASVLTRGEVIKCVKQIVDGENGSNGFDFMPEEITQSTFIDSKTNFKKTRVVITGILLQGGDVMKGRGTLEVEMGVFAKTVCTSQVTLF